MKKGYYIRMNTNHLKEIKRLSYVFSDGVQSDEHRQILELGIKARQKQEKALNSKTS